MTLQILLIYIFIAAAVLTGVVGYFKSHKSWLMTFLQNFTGALFVFSGWVKAVDPLGTAYKMEQYFAEFTTTFEGTWLSFLAPLFPWLSNYSTLFSIVMIIFEIILGLMLILGVKGKLTSWLFLGLVGFFTFLTGFTYLTGYVPSDVNFFDFGSWSSYKASNMKVTDCGCFGDFIKLEPKTSFFKDVALLVPAIFFVFKHRDMHELFLPKVRNIILGTATVGLLVYCFNNFKWNLPHTDFRPFKINTDVKAKREIEEEAQANVRVVAWKLQNEKDGKIVEMPTDQYFAALTTYSKENGWKVLEQISTEPSIKPSKISEFEITDLDHNDVTYEYLDSEDYNFMIVSHKTYGKVNVEEVMTNDTIFSTDTIMVDGSGEKLITKSIKEINKVNRKKNVYEWDKSWMNDYLNKIKPLAELAKANGQKVSIVLGGASKEAAIDFAQKSGIVADYYSADDILLKTIIRSNPGVVLWKDGKILHKWHINKLPKYEDIKAKHIK